MEMTIDEAITEVQQQKLDYQEFWEEYKNEHIEALDMAINTMRKYQKIKQIIDDWEHDVYPTSDDALDDVERIVEDGSNNQHN